jgi:hypothetical protein
MWLSFLIRTSSDQRPFAGFPKLIAGYRVLRRLSMPRHPPCTLNSLTTVTDHRHPPYREGGVPYTRPTTDQIILNFAGFIGHARCCRSRRLSRSPKRCSTTPRPKRKRPCPDRCRKRRPETKCQGVTDLARPPHAGGYRQQRPPKPSVEPLFTCQRTSVRQAAPK